MSGEAKLKITILWASELRIASKALRDAAVKLNASREEDTPEAKAEVSVAMLEAVRAAYAALYHCQNDKNPIIVASVDDEQLKGL